MLWLIVTELFLGKVKPGMQARGEANRTIIKSAETKILDSWEFLNNSYNKTELVDQIFDWFKINRAKVLNNLRTTNV